MSDYESDCFYACDSLRQIASWPFNIFTAAFAAYKVRREARECLVNIDYFRLLSELGCPPEITTDRETMEAMSREQWVNYRPRNRK